MPARGSNSKDTFINRRRKGITKLTARLHCSQSQSLLSCHGKRSHRLERHAGRSRSPLRADQKREMPATFISSSTLAYPHLQLIVITCMDARIIPHNLFNLQVEEAHIICNAGGNAFVCLPSSRWTYPS